jgi:hypothetical protein
MSSTDETAAEPTYGDGNYTRPSTEVALREEVEELRAALVELKQTAGAPARVIPKTLDEWVLVVRDYNLLAQSLAKTAFVPANFKGKPDQITAVMMYGREIGLPPMTTLQNTYEVYGRVGMYAEQLRAMILDAGHDFTIDEMTSDRCTLSGQRKGRERWETFTYTMDQAKTAGLYAQNEQYRKRPVEMLFARATGIMAHAMFPDVIRGMAAVEELEDLGGAAVEAPPVAVEPARKSTATVGRKRASKAAIDPGPVASPEVAKPEVVVPDKAGIPPLPGEAEAPVAVSDEPRRMNVEEALSAGHPDNMTDEEYERFRQARMTGPDNETPPADEEYIRRLHEQRWAQYAQAREHYGADVLNEDGTLTAKAIASGWRIDRGQEAGGRWDLIPPASGPVAVAAKPMHTAQTKALQARFKGLGFTDEPDDREQRLMIAAAIVGHDVDTFRAGTMGEGMTYDEADQVLKVLAPCRSREDVIELMVRISQDAAAEEAQG